MTLTFQSSRYTGREMTPLCALLYVTVLWCNPAAELYTEAAAAAVEGT